MPILKPVWLLGLHSNPARSQPVTDVATDVRFGLWGYCASGYQFSSSGSPYFAQDYQCSHPKLGFTITPTVETLLGDNRLADVLLKGVTYALLLQPISCIITFLILIPSIVGIFHPLALGFVTIVSLLLSIIAAFIETIDFVLVIVLVKVAQSRVSAATENQFTLQWGPAVWMSLAATVCLWFGVIGLSALVCGCCGVRSRRAELKELQYKNEKGEDDTT
ncbi:hypothetical protein FRB93_008946 [Tulasnella sp. JGI-2019a]|nr:hypothetical protein FRB93_008946 [Tulasnella sp. JGI-2019a]